METIFIDRKSTKLACNHQRLYIGKSVNSSEETNLPSSIPLTHLKSVVISCDCALSSGMLRQLAKHDVSLICLNNRDPDASFMSINETHGNILRRISQYHLLDCSFLRIRFSTVIIKRKISSHRNLLQNIMKQRKDLRGPLNLINKELMQLQNKLNQDNLKLNEIMGIEGYASRLYFSAYKRAFSENLDFNKRTKRPPKDPVNVILSLSYTLLHYEAQRACYGQGLDPYLSILHNPSYGRASLACDLQESLRADIDKWVWQLFSTRIIRIDHFSEDENAPILNKAGRKEYYAELPKQIAAWRLKLRKHAKLLVNIIDSAGLIKLEGESA